jgi:acetyltransferase-like isoleucine patch superfamily enzyme
MEKRRPKKICGIPARCHCISYEVMSLISSGQTAQSTVTIKRLVRKMLQGYARRSSFLPARGRVLLQGWCGVKFLFPRTVFLGGDVYFDNLYHELISVGRYVRITQGAKILSHFIDTQYVPEPGRPFRFICGQVIIKDYVFVGTGAVIAKPVTINAWAVIGANAVVTRDVPRGAIVVGSPATIIGYRKIPEGADGSTT